MAATPDRTSYLPTLDGWRGIAILMVVLGHAAKPAYCGDAVMPGWCKYVLLGGHGVALFFALSGFLITSRLLNEFDRTNRISLRDFYRRRVFRILPAALVFLLLIAVLGATGVLPVEPIEITSSALFFRNYVPLYLGERGAGFYSALYWSLSVEEHFYLLWPLLLAVSLRKGVAARVTIGLAIAIALWRRLDGHYRWVQYALDLPQYQFYYRTDTRLDALLWGCTLALLLRDASSRAHLQRFLRPATWWGLVVIYAAGIALEWRGVLWFTLLCPPLIVGTLLHPDSAVARILEWRALRWVGHISFSLYLWHPLFMPQIDAAAAWPRAQSLPLNILLAFLFAALSYYLVEKPMITLGKKRREATM